MRWPKGEIRGPIRMERAWRAGTALPARPAWLSVAERGWQAAWMKETRKGIGTALHAPVASDKPGSKLAHDPSPHLEKSLLIDLIKNHLENAENFGSLSVEERSSSATRKKMRRNVPIKKFRRSTQKVFCMKKKIHLERRRLNSLPYRY